MPCTCRAQVGDERLQRLLQRRVPVTLNRESGPIGVDRARWPAVPPYGRTAHSMAASARRIVAAAGDSRTS